MLLNRTVRKVLSLKCMEVLFEKSDGFVSILQVPVYCLSIYCYEGTLTPGYSKIHGQ